MNYIATIGEKEVKISVEEVGVARYKVTIDGSEHVIDAHRLQESLWSLLNGSRAFEVDVQQKDEAFEVLIDGDCYKFSMVNEQQKALARAAGTAGAGRAMITSPMPGKVVRLLVEQGQEVQADQGVIIVEAMKMENELKSAVAGTVKEIFVKDGEVVDMGAKLLLVE